MTDGRKYPDWEIPELGEEAIGRIARRGEEKVARRRVRRRRGAQAGAAAAIVAIVVGIGLWRTTTFDYQVASVRGMLEEEIARRQDNQVMAHYDRSERLDREVPDERTIRD